MGQIFKIEKFEREEAIGIAKKRISASDNSFSFEGPVVTQRVFPFDPDNNKVNEIIEHINPKRVKTIESNKIKDFTENVKDYFCRNKLNITIFDLQYNDMPNDDTVRLIAQALHGASEKAIFLPAIRKSLVQSIPQGRKCASWDENKFLSYKNMLKLMVEEIRMHNNGKEIVGMIPFFLPIKYQRQVIDYYLAEGVRTFAIDANFSDLMNNEEDLCFTLSRIKKGVDGLEKTVIFAFNTGISYYDEKEVVSDDFLSIFAYVDVLGSSFKTRGGGSGPFKGRVFSSEKYSYDTILYLDLQKKFGRNVNYLTVKNSNRSEQSKETGNVRPLVGERKIKPYLATKSAVVKRESIKRLESIAQKVG
jgi:hypothetical protein